MTAMYMYICYVPLNSHQSQGFHLQTAKNSEEVVEAPLAKGLGSSLREDCCSVITRLNMYNIYYIILAGRLWPVLQSFVSPYAHVMTQIGCRVKMIEQPSP